MNIKEFLLKYGSKLNDLEEKFLINVYYNDFGDKGLKYISPQYEIVKPDGSGIWRYDFYIKTEYGEYIIETDGLYSHAEGKVTNEYYNNLQEKQNEVINKGIKLIRFTNSEVRENPQDCMWRLRRLFMGDKTLQDIYLNRIGKIEPHEVQNLVLSKLNDTRNEGKKKGLVVIATGLGKTYLSAFDVKQFNPKKALFIVHINEILKQSQNSFEDVLPSKKKEMGFYNGVSKEKDKSILFASIQTLSRKKHLENFKPTEFDYIIIDESHHTAAPTYKKIFDYFKPKFILGLTATPDRMDKKEILPLYDDNVVFEMHQEEAIKKGYLVPFHYYGFKDDIDYSEIYFNGFRYDVNDLNKLLMINKRDEAVISKFREYAIDKKTKKIRKTIGFCVSVEHANWCTDKFKQAGYKAVSIHSKLDNPDIDVNEKDRDKIIKRFREGEYDIAFVVNMFNEGIDIPDVECLLFLRPTESKSIFIQHMGRGLRISPNKENVLILDFIGNYRTAGLVLGGLGYNKNPSELKKEVKDKKNIYYYDNNGCRVEFEEEVVDIFKKLNANSNKEVLIDEIPEEWIEYSNYLNGWTKNNLYWKRGQQNKYFEVNFEGINIIKNNPNITDSEFKKEISEIINNKYKGKNMSAGFRGLFISKITGFINYKKPIKIQTPFLKLLERTNNFENPNNYLDIITNQLEKIFYWNSIYGSYNKYVPENKRVSFKDFKIYPFFFIYDIMIKLLDEYGFEDTYISNLEFNSFLAIIKNHNEIDEVMDRIVKYRDIKSNKVSGNIYELEKLLKQKNNIDPRFYHLLYYNKYFSINKNGFKIKNEFIDEIRNKVIEFRTLLKKNKIIIPFEDDSIEYEKLLYSELDLLAYHKND